MGDPIEAVRDFFARFIVTSCGASNQRLIAAFSAVHREDYVGEGPWLVRAGQGCISTVSDDPRLLYQDILVAIDASSGINNGQPMQRTRSNRFIVTICPIRARGASGRVGGYRRLRRMANRSAAV